MIYNLYCRLALTIYILVAYAFYPDFHLAVDAVPHSLYQYLTQSFLAGHLDLLVQPSQELLNLPDPYDPVQNYKLRLHDASLYNDKYYLYFGPLPIIVFHIPFKLLTGFYPSDGLAAFFFLSLGFMVNFFLIIKIKEQYFPRISELQLGLMGALLGFANGAPFLMSRPVVYEIAIASTFCFMSFALFFLYKITQKYKTKDIILFSLCLSLCVAGRPHFVLICFCLLPALFIYLIKHTSKNRFTLITALFAPAAGVGFMLALYNYVRFGSIWNFGHIWQLSCNNIKALHKELSNLGKIPRNLLYSSYFYFLQPFLIVKIFPYIRLIWHNCRYHIDNDYYLEAIVGVFITTPFILLVLALPKLILIYFRNRKKTAPLLWFLLFTSFVPFITTLFLLILPFAIQRYQVDFIPYWVLLAIITFWLYEDYARHSIHFKIIKIIFIVTAVMSIYMGFSLGLGYWTTL
ncbi:Uncharacterised protein [Legionella busanensis]|uniref:Glycosyltransferase RgtA/B/C/D-like domain-containing protein n=1 Tax=Legionella busanensis TaxID=190655 RepID=A0A378JW22_9GAMM|nr:hypothetical protein [Legionella busanensis]STX52412.1 Uncharacterised protein [Legionella busanensis]